LLPLLAVCLLIAIALFLRSEKYVTLRWVGALLIFLSGFGLIGLVILLIGFNQFIALLINRYLSNLVDGFAALLLELIQKVGFMTLAWIIISAIIVLAFGTFLLLMSRLFRPKSDKNHSLIERDGNLHKDDLLSKIEMEENNTKKVVQPETLEEVEAREKNSTKNLE
jgi:hypothetical protein